MALNAIQTSAGSPAILTMNRGNVGVLTGVISRIYNHFFLPPVTGGGDEVSFYSSSN